MFVCEAAVRSIGVRLVVAQAIFLCSALCLAQEMVPVEDYGQLPLIRSISISPDGKHYAYIQRGKEGDFFVIMNTETSEIIGGANASDVKARSVDFATNDLVVLRTSKTASSFSIRGKWEQGSSVIYNINTKKMRLLTRRIRDLYPAQGGLGRIVGFNSEENTAYVPAFIGSENPSYNLMRIELDGGSTKRHAKGTPHTVDWFVDKQGTVLAREDFHERRQEHRIFSKTSGKWQAIYTLETDIPRISVRAVTSDGKSLIINKGNVDNEATYTMSLEDGEISGPLYEKEGSDIDAILTDGLTREFSGVRYSGLLPFYEYQDSQKNNHVADVQANFPTSAVRPVSATADWSKIIFLVSGNDGAREYLIFDTVERNLGRVASSYPDVKKEHVGEIKAIRYKARDGLAIKAVLTWPVGIEKRKNLPMLVFPHGGPESYDSIRFDWWAQYFARKGYVIFQPNFRGSTGSGFEFRDAGRGEWGKAMQDDITDGVQAMIRAGYADANRVCIMGASYGGYAALAGGAFTPDTYRCVVSVAGVSDLPMMLRNVKYTSGSRNWVVSYWHSLVGDSKAEKENLKSISPANFAESFGAPVLLLHGKDDSVVPISQSKRMERALKKADKPVELITLKGEDHWLSNSDTRLQLLRTISEFLQEHNPVNVH